MIQYQILRNSIINIVWQTVRRIIKEILGVKGLKPKKKSERPPIGESFKQHAYLPKFKLGESVCGLCYQVEKEYLKRIIFLQNYVYTKIGKFTLSS